MHGRARKSMPLRKIRFRVPFALRCVARIWLLQIVSAAAASARDQSKAGPTRVKLDSLLDLFGRFAKSPRVIQRISYLCDCNNRERIKRLSMEMDRNRFIATLCIPQKNSALPVDVRIARREFDRPPRLVVRRLPNPNRRASEATRAPRGLQ